MIACLQPTTNKKTASLPMDKDPAHLKYKLKKNSANSVKPPPHTHTFQNWPDRLPTAFSSANQNVYLCYLPTIFRSCTLRSPALGQRQQRPPLLQCSRQGIRLGGGQLLVVVPAGAQEGHKVSGQLEGYGGGPTGEGGRHRAEGEGKE